MKRLIINADDFGLAPGVNRAIVELHRAGALSSTTLMANGPSFSSAVHAAFMQPALAVGCHVVLIDGKPSLQPAQVPSLIDPRRRASSLLRSEIGSFYRDLASGRIRPEEIEAEAIAQIRRIQSSGLTVSHIDSHKHVHAFPRALAPLLNAARACGVKCVRNPFEPGWSLKATGSRFSLRRTQVYVLGTQQRAWARLLLDSGIRTTDGSVGVLATGTLNEKILRSVIRAMPAGTWELVCHPGYLDPTLERTNTRLRLSREIERSALLDVIPGRLRYDPDLTMIDFHQLARE